MPSAETLLQPLGVLAMRLLPVTWVVRDL